MQNPPLFITQNKFVGKQYEVLKDRKFSHILNVIKCFNYTPKVFKEF